jgi:hypothetical protein
MGDSMVYVRLARDWTDATGAAHHSGEMVDVDAVTLAELEATGVVAAAADKGTDWVGPTSDPDWVGPTSDPSWVGPTGDPDWVGPTGDGK